MTREINTAEKLPVELDDRIVTALKAMSEKKATDIVVLHIGSVASFTEFFLICSGSSTRQVQAIAGDVVQQTARHAGPTDAHRRRKNERVGSGRLRRFRCARVYRGFAAFL